MKQLLKVPPIRDFLLEYPVLEHFGDVFSSLKLPGERKKEVLDLINAVIDGALPPKEVPGLVQEAFGVSEDVAKKLAADVLGYGVLPLEHFIPGIPEAITAFGGDVAHYPSQRVEKEKLSSMAWQKRLTEEVGIQFSDVLQKRLAFLLESRLKGEKTADALRTFFGRALQIGGLGLEKNMGDALLGAVEAEVPYVEIISDEDFAVLQEEQQKKAVPQVAQPEPGEEEIVSAQSHELANTVPVIAHEEHAPKPRTAGENSGRASFEEAVALVLVKAEPMLKKKKIAEKTFADLAGKTIRGVRDLTKTKEKLMRDFSLSKEDVSFLGDALEEGLARYHAKTAGREELTDEVAEAITEAEAAVLDKRFTALTQNAPEEHVEPILPGARVSAAFTGSEELQKSAKHIRPEDEAKLLAARKPKLAKAELTVGSVAPKGEGRKVSDVVTASRLLGPIDQLKTLTPVEFRRLSSNPLEASQKVEDLISAIESAAYEDKVKAVKAFRLSPLNQLYLAITEEALGSGVSVPEVASKRRGAGKESLSPAEIQSLVQLNARLRF